MLKELKATRQIPGEPFRRWYTDNDNDLVVWLEQHRITGFQLLVPGSCGRTVVTWHEGERPTVAGLDDGEGRPGRAKMTPILIHQDTIDVGNVLQQFKGISEELPSGLAKLVEDELAELSSAKRISEQGTRGP